MGRSGDYRERLLATGTEAIAELGFAGVEGENMVVLANEPGVHNMVVCTLCSCYPWPVLGLPPNWYKSPPYRARAVAEPRAVLSEFGLELGADVEIRVWDSSAEVRYSSSHAAGRDRDLGRERARGDRDPRLHDRDCRSGRGVTR